MQMEGRKGGGVEDWECLKVYAVRRNKFIFDTIKVPLFLVDGGFFGNARFKTGIFN